MAISSDQYDQILNRLTRLEEAVNDAFVAMKRLVTLSQVNQLLTITQTQVDDLNTTVEALQDRVLSIEEEPAS